MAVLIALIARLRAQAGERHRQLLGRSDALARSTSCCRCRSLLACALVTQGVVQTFQPYKTVAPGAAGRVRAAEERRRRQAGQGQGRQAGDGEGDAKEQTLPLGPAASQIAIKQLGTNGGGFFNVNSAHPFENPTPLSNFLEMLAILLISGGALLHLRPHDRRHAPGLGAARRDDDASSCGFLAVCSLSEQAGNPLLAQARRRAAARQHGRQGGALRRRQLRALGDGDDRGLERLGQLDARLLHAARRPGADGADAARRDHLRRRRLGPLRHAGLRHRRGVHRRPDGRAHAGVRSARRSRPTR